MKGYKAFNKNMTCRNFQYEISGKYELEGELKICERGFHFCKNLIDVYAFYEFSKDTIVCEVNAYGNILQQGIKFCTDKIEIVTIIDWEYIQTLIKDGNYNTGWSNTGRYNSGNFNSGSYNSGYNNTSSENSGDFNSGHGNSGSYNSGKHNDGNFNSGDHNNGNFNTGHYNTGYYNTGSYNAGSYNSGEDNSGDCNSGHSNGGSHNTGDYNSGSDNSGNYNSGNHNSGFFNSNTPTVRLFNKDSGLTYEEFYELDIDWQCLTNSKDKIKALPNYDAQIFYEATGIDWRNENEAVRN